MWMCFLSKVAVHPLSHNCPMDKSDFPSSGKICAFLAAVGRSGSSMSPVVFEYIFVPCGSWTYSGMSIVCFL